MIEELKELIQTWRNRANRQDENGEFYEEYESASRLHLCATELEQLLLGLAEQKVNT